MAAATHPAGSATAVPEWTVETAPRQRPSAHCDSREALPRCTQGDSSRTSSIFSRSGTCRLLLVSLPQRSPERLTLFLHCADPTMCDNGFSSDTERNVC
ncbi:hypothetical protein AVEN_226874-1 [Araneus ventricosus]|uniref:Uncharacterized protein n=1 Tax=Araneus ventricosus TaxID=182803 RepID=A0A4Y2H7H9_ARAVE|nr:hypothetical protein AVEN_226874-1 [Araneus ventricosus]